MRETKIISWEELAELFGGTHDMFTRAMSRGDGIAVYTNMAMDSRDAGRQFAFSYGSSSAQIQGEPPHVNPVNAMSTPWAYLLTHKVVRNVNNTEGK